jgi:hypothetical protein
MGDQIVALEYETHGVIAVGIPILAPKILGGFSADDQIARGILISRLI